MFSHAVAMFAQYAFDRISHEGNKFEIRCIEQLLGLIKTVMKSVSKQFGLVVFEIINFGMVVFVHKYGRDCYSDGFGNMQEYDVAINWLRRR